MELPEQIARTERLETRAIFLSRGSRGQNGPQIPHVKVFHCVLKTQNKEQRSIKLLNVAEHLVNSPQTKITEQKEY